MKKHENLTKEIGKLRKDVKKSDILIDELLTISNQYDIKHTNGFKTRLNALVKINDDAINDITLKEDLINNIHKYYVEKIEEIIQHDIPSLDVCMICKSYVQIPVIPCCWKCAKHPLPTCRVIICLKCMYYLFNYIPKCPICRNNSITNKLSDAYTVDFEKMRILDSFIEKYSSKKIIQCHRCVKYFGTLYKCWKHYIKHHMKIDEKIE